jgi:hypothetical protein
MSDARNIVWIASYPKSGNTWIRFLVGNLLFGRQESAAALHQLVPDIHELRESFTIPTVRQAVKTHFVATRLKPLLPYTAAAIYVVRHPADVMISNFHYLRRSGTHAPSLEQYVDAFIEHRGDPRWMQAGMGSWADNVLSWTRTPFPFPVLCLRYDDLLNEPVVCVHALTELLGYKTSREEIERAVADSSFERMREIEEADIRAQRVGIFYKPYLQGSIDSGLRFMRSGKSGSAEEVLSGERLARFQAAFGPLMGELGYPIS